MNTLLDENFVLKSGKMSFPTIRISIFARKVSMALLFKGVSCPSKSIVEYTTKEAIKNSYDAGASIIRVRLKYSKSLGLILSIADNGKGVNAIDTSMKEVNKENYGCDGIAINEITEVVCERLQGQFKLYRNQNGAVLSIKTIP